MQSWIWKNEKINAIKNFFKWLVSPVDQWHRCQRDYAKLERTRVICCATINSIWPSFHYKMSRENKFLARRRNGLSNWRPCPIVRHPVWDPRVKIARPDCLVCRLVSPSWRYCEENNCSSQSVNNNFFFFLNLLIVNDLQKKLIILIIRYTLSQKNK